MGKTVPYKYWLATVALIIVMIFWSAREEAGIIPIFIAVTAGIWLLISMALTFVRRFEKIPSKKAPAPKKHSCLVPIVVFAALAIATYITSQHRYDRGWGHEIYGYLIVLFPIAIIAWGLLFIERSKTHPIIKILGIVGVAILGAIIFGLLVFD